MTEGWIHPDWQGLIDCCYTARDNFEFIQRQVLNLERAGHIPSNVREACIRILQERGDEPPMQRRLLFE